MLRTLGPSIDGWGISRSRDAVGPRYAWSTCGGIASKGACTEPMYRPPYTKACRPNALLHPSHQFRKCAEDEDRVLPNFNFRYLLGVHSLH